ncbi:HLH domain-containing protein [Oryctes borbonicus]|uniref:HLH domain-containing protein n=1 Tax=Oryctes borbonicus TaxID=1629725 RepID=A0A0T6B341_9SCAR|nr:HLH domain-containing protein [Oryctes borbonicus]
MRFLIHIVTLLQILNLRIYFVNAQRVPPGVSPQHYQQQQQYQQAQYQQQQPQYQQQHHQQVPVQHQQQVPVQHQQPPVQQHQVPVQQVPQHQVPQQQVSQQQVPHQQPLGQPQQPHGHGHGHQQGKILDTQHIMQEKDHIAEHMDVPLDTSKMSEQELQFHYFKMHDADNNNKLDGCELIKSLIHWHEQGSKDPAQTQIEDKIFRDDELVTLIDPILNMDDNNRDGYIDYPEFIRAQKVSSQNNQV